MNEYNLNQQIAKLQRHLDEVPAVKAQLETLQRQKDELTQQRYANSPEEQNAHKALRSNNARLMLQRAAELKALSHQLKRQQDALPADSPKWHEVTALRNRLYELRDSLETKAAQLTAAKTPEPETPTETAPDSMTPEERRQLQAVIARGQQKHQDQYGN